MTDQELNVIMNALRLEFPGVCFRTERDNKRVLIKTGYGESKITVCPQALHDQKLINESNTLTDFGAYILMQTIKLFKHHGLHSRQNQK